jgi:hypothetical protein
MPLYNCFPWFTHLPLQWLESLRKTYHGAVT